VIRPKVRRRGRSSPPWMGVATEALEKNRLILVNQV
jgi:hypothetical protein